MHTIDKKITSSFPPVQTIDDGDHLNSENLSAGVVALVERTDFLEENKADVNNSALTGDTSVQNLVAAFLVLATSGSTGGLFKMKKPLTGSTLTSDMNVEIYNNSFRVYESGGTKRGFYIDLSQCSASVGTPLATGNYVGIIGHFAQASIPVGWLKANGAAVSRTTYAALFAVIGTLYGAGNGSTTFNLPDLRGEFIRGWDDGRGIDSGRGIGSFQESTKISDRTGVNASVGIVVAISNGEGIQTETAASSSFAEAGVGSTTVNSTGDINTFALHPRNYALMVCIKY